MQVYIPIRTHVRTCEWSWALAGYSHGILLNSFSLSLSLLLLLLPSCKNEIYIFFVIVVVVVVGRSNAADDNSKEKHED